MILTRKHSSRMRTDRRSDLHSGGWGWGLGIYPRYSTSGYPTPRHPTSHLDILLPGYPTPPPPTRKEMGLGSDLGSEIPYLPVNRHYVPTTWMAIGNYCFLLVADRCGPVPARANVVPNTTESSWNTVVSYECAPGYEWANSTLVCKT